MSTTFFIRRNDAARSLEFAYAVLRAKSDASYSFSISLRITINSISAGVHHHADDGCLPTRYSIGAEANVQPPNLPTIAASKIKPQKNHMPLPDIVPISVRKPV